MRRGQQFLATRSTLLGAYTVTLERPCDDDSRHALQWRTDMAEEENNAPAEKSATTTTLLVVPRHKIFML
jgi:hypothetical protein